MERERGLQCEVSVTCVCQRKLLSVKNTILVNT